MSLSDRARQEDDKKRQELKAEIAEREAHKADEKQATIARFRELIHEWAATMGVTVSSMSDVRYDSKRVPTYDDGGYDDTLNVSATFRADNLDFAASQQNRTGLSVTLGGTNWGVNTLADLGSALRSADKQREEDKALQAAVPEKPRRRWRR